MSGYIPASAQVALTTFLEQASDPLVVGIYLTGSVVLNDFQPGKSDLDLTIVLSKPDLPFIRKMREVHRRLARRQGLSLNGYYISLADLCGGISEVVYFEEKQFRKTPFIMKPMLAFELKSTGLCLRGVPIEELPLRSETEETDHFLHKNMHDYWSRWVFHKPFSRERVLLFLFPRITEWILLGLSRQVATLHTKQIYSKASAGMFCLMLLPESFHSIMQEAVAIRKEKTVSRLRLGSYAIGPSLKRTLDTVACGQKLYALFEESYQERYRKHPSG
jgi:hypothetical protein